MATRTVIIESTDSSGKKLQKSVTNINPAASAEQLQTTINKLNVMSTNVYQSANVIDKRAVDEATPTPTPTPTPSSDKKTAYLGIDQVANGIIYNGDGQLFLSANNRQFFLSMVGEILSDKWENSGDCLTVYATEGERYAAAYLYVEVVNGMLAYSVGP